MKKSLVITTIATVLVIVVALTTATFAWFSSSNETTATGNFTAQSTSAEFMFYPYLSNNSGYDYANGQTLLDFSTAVQTSDADRIFGVFTLENMKPFVPTAIIGNSAAPVTIASGNWTGLPGEKFYTGTVSSDGKQLNSVYNSAQAYSNYATAGAPSIARFELYNPTKGDAASAKQLDVTFSITGQGNAADIGVGNAIRFVMIGIPSVDGDVSEANADGKAFIIGTEYSYGGISLPITDASNNVALNTYNQAETGSYTSFVADGYKNLAEVTSMGTNTNGKIEYTFTDANLKVSPGASYEIYLYIWMDGATVKDGSRGGSVAIEINFSVPEEETP